MVNGVRIPFTVPTYIILPVKLDAKPKYIPVTGVSIDVLEKSFSAETTADTGKVYIALNGVRDLVPVNRLLPIEMPFRQIVLTWDDSETGKTIIFIVGVTARAIIKKSKVVVEGDLVGLAKDTTVQNITKFQFDEDSDLYVATRSVEDSATYTTTDTFAQAVSIDICKFDKFTLLIKNEGTNNADIYVVTKANKAGVIEYPEYGSSSSPVTLEPGDVVKIQLNGQYGRVIVYAKSSVEGASTTLRFEWIGGK